MKNHSRSQEILQRNTRTRFFPLGLIFFSIAFSFPCTKSYSIQPEGPDKRVKVIKVIDGDTVIVANGEKVRYLGIDTPERGEPFYQESSQANRRLVEGKTIRLESGYRERDSYDRILAYVWVDDILVNAELVQGGYARVRGPLDDRYRKIFLKYQQEAFRDQRGLWKKGAGSSPVQIYQAHIDARRDDRKNLNDEYIVFRNTGSEPVTLTGWAIMDEYRHRYLFPEFTLSAGKTVTLFTGTGKNTADRLYWGSERPIWNNRGDTIFLYNDEGKLVLMHMY